ncbi:hypothetical protein [Abyssibius alkaniclasticus]|uniref:hypothetical protein n=1 Tax=Abyssibius alkaniclasticus TaxID=2881234 RepID=UPI004059C535
MMTEDNENTPAKPDSAEFSVDSILSAIRQRVTAETGARYARDSARMQHEMLVLQPEARIDDGLGETIASSGATLRRKVAQSDAALEARVLEILLKALKNPASPLRAALRAALKDEPGG